MLDAAQADDEHDQLCAALFVLVKRNGGMVVIDPTDLPSTEYTILRRRTEDGGLEIRVFADSRQ